VSQAGLLAWRSVASAPAMCWLWPGEGPVAVGGELGADAGALDAYGAGAGAPQRGPAQLRAADCAVRSGSARRVGGRPLCARAGAERVVRFVLAWHSPHWYAGGTPDPLSLYASPGYQNRNRRRCDARWARAARTPTCTPRGFSNALEVARTVGPRARHSTATRHRLAVGDLWRESSCPAGCAMRSSNILHLITETGFWAMAPPGRSAPGAA